MMLAGSRLVAGEEWVRAALKARFPVLFVDEYQDLGVPLHRIVVHLASAGTRVIAVGDPDQSIYGFTGARPELLRRLAGANGVEKVTLRFNYRCGKTIVSASEVVLGEARGYESRGGRQGLIDWHCCPDGLEHQAGFVCAELIPAALARKPGRKLGDVAVLYRTRHHGDGIAARAAAHGMKFSRNDANAPYPKTPLTRWLEECAAWCAGGWREGTPPLSALVRAWLRFRQSAASPSERHALKRVVCPPTFGPGGMRVLPRIG
jgi:DNA helicase-2/ATP-dependent DNA helicase PcrA